MSGIGEASLVLGLISSTIAIFEAVQEIYEAASDVAGLPKKLRLAAEQIPLVHNALSLAEKNINLKNVTEDALLSAQPVLERCKECASSVKDIFDKTIPTKDTSRTERLKKAVGIKMKSNRVKEYMQEIFKSIELLAQNQVFQDAEALNDITEAIEQLSNMPDEEEQPHFVYSGTGAQYNQTGPGTQNIVSGNQYTAGTQNFGRDQAYTADDIDRACLRTLRCPDSLIVKNRLKENKDKLLHKSIDWIFKDEQYKSWQSREDVFLLWIKGGAGKGKTMMSIGLVEELSRLSKHATVVAYFFCQNADYELNTISAIIKGLILQLVSQQQELMKSLRDRWDTRNQRFSEDVTSWRGLWDIFMEMLNRCKCPRVYLIIDALDECQDDGMASLLKLIVRTGHGLPSQIKWLLTSQPLNSAEQELLTGSDQVMVSLDLNTKYISQGVATYISYKIAELDRRHKYGSTLRQDIEKELTRKAEDTFLWISLVCKEVEDVGRDQVMKMIRDLPHGLISYYHRILTQLCARETSVVMDCARLLKTMMLAYRPLNISEVSSVTGLPDDQLAIKALVNQCASFIKIRAKDIEFVHQSARDFLAGEDGQALLDSYDEYGHGEVAISCLSYLSRHLKVNLLCLARPDSTREKIGVMEEEVNEVLLSLDYAATSWVQHIALAKHTTMVQDTLAEHGTGGIFLRAKLLEWLECLSLLGKLSHAIKVFEKLTYIANSQKSQFLSILMQDATRFLLRHYQTVAAWPLQIYSSAIIFSPQSSELRRGNLDRIPPWLGNIPRTEDVWTSLIQTLSGHSDWVWAVAFSPDGKQVATGSADRTIKLWDAATGEAQRTLRGHSFWVSAVAFSPDGKQVASGSWDRTIKLWDAATGEVQRTLSGHSFSVRAVAFSPDGKQVASGSEDRTIKLWDAATGEAQRTLSGHSGSVTAVAFSPDGKQVASGSEDGTIKLWDAATGEVQRTLSGHSDWVRAVAFSPDGKQVASGSKDGTIKLWDAATGEVQRTLSGHSDSVTAVAFSPDGKQVASGSEDGTIKLWDAATGEAQRTLRGHSDWVTAVAFSPDGKQVASGSKDGTIKLWDAATGEVQRTLRGHSDWVTAVAFSPDGKQVASGSADRTIKLWDAATGEVQRTLSGHSDRVWAVTFSPDGKQVASGSTDRTIKLWDAATGEVQRTLSGHSGSVRAVAFSPDGKQVASGSWDCTIKLWDAATGEVQKTLSGCSGPVMAVAFSPDGKQVVSGSANRTIKLWDITKSRMLERTFGRQIKFPWQGIKTSRPILTLEFSADGRYLATNLGYIKIKGIIPAEESADPELSRYLYISRQWIYYGATPVLRIPADFYATCDAKRGSQLTIGFGNGQVLSFDIDYAVLGTSSWLQTVAT